MKDENESAVRLSLEEIAMQQLEYTKKQYQLTKFLSCCTAIILVVVIVASTMFYHRFDAIYKDLVVISYNEVEANIELQSVGMVTA